MIFSLILLVFKSPKSSIQSFCAPNIILFAFAQMTTTADTLSITPVYQISDFWNGFDALHLFMHFETTLGKPGARSSL